MNSFLNKDEVYRYWVERYNSVPVRVDPVNSWGKHSFFLFCAATSTMYWDLYNNDLQAGGVYDELTAPAYIGTLDYMIRAGGGVAITGDCGLDIRTGQIESVDYSSNFYILNSMTLHRFANGTYTGDPFPAGMQQSLYFPNERSFGYIQSTYVVLDVGVAAGGQLDCEVFLAFRGYRVFLN